jgi:peptidoglycan hydrolase CwlO-like protein
MKQSIRTLAVVLTLATMLISACGAVNASANIAAAKVHASEIAFTGVIEAINGNQWTINGQIVTVDPSVASDGTFKVGDTVKVGGVTAVDGSINVTSIEVVNDDGSVDDNNDAATPESVDNQNNDQNLDENQSEIDENQSEIDENQDEIQSNDQNQDENQSQIDENNSDNGSAGDSSQPGESVDNSGSDNGSGGGGSDNGSGGG